MIQDRDRDRDRDSVVIREHSDRGHHYGWRRHHAECQVVKTRTELPNGKAIFKTRRTCD
ncbi:MAG: hypothetical protein HY244_12625 [Rhizobiales bacterium]|nr:hypothetical protein [Hyphomicrobiales bacterium]